MVQIPLEFIQMVENDIELINKLIDSEADEETLKSLHMELDGKYQACIKNWDNSMYGWVKNFGFSYEFLGVSSLLCNLKIMKAKLTSYKYQVNAIPNMVPDTTVNVSIDNNIDIKISFETVRSQIDNNTSLTTEQTIEAKQKVNEIEAIVKSKDSKKNKWQKAKPILVWLADKSVDVGTAILPLLLKIH